MAAYVIVDIEVTDQAGYDEYRALAPQTVAAYGGKYLVRGGPFEILEGNWKPKRLVVIEFESIEQAKRWYKSPEYSVALPMRQKTTISNMVFIEGT